MGKEARRVFTPLAAGLTSIAHNLGDGRRGIRLTYRALTGQSHCDHGQQVAQRAEEILRGLPIRIFIIGIMELAGCQFMYLFLSTPHTAPVLQSGCWAIIWAPRQLC